MTDFRRFPANDTRQIIDYNRFMDLTGTKVFICIDKGVLEIAKYLLNSRGNWRSTYVKEYLEIGYNMPTIEEFNNVTQAIAEANIDMASCDDIVEAINGIKTAIIQNGSSGGCGCIGDGGTDVTDVNDSPSSEIPGLENWEELGFASEEAFSSHKCNVAVEILENYIQTLRNWAGLFGTVGGLTLAVVTGLLLLTVPPVGLILIMAAFGLLVGSDIGLLINLSTIAGDLEAAIDELKCSFYNATSTSEAATALTDKANEIIDGLAIGFFTDTFKQITSNLISNDELLKLFDSSYVSTVTDADCSECISAGPILYTCIYPEVPDFNDDGYMILVAELAGSDYFLAYGFDGSKNYDITLESGSYTSPSAVPTFMTAMKAPDATFCGLGSGAGWDSITTSFPSSTWVSPGTIQLRSGSPFSVRFTPFD